MERSGSWAAWIGKSAIVTDCITPGPIRGLLATLAAGDIELTDTAPLLAHWLYFHSYAPLQSLAVDGHPRRGDFLPPIPAPRRMWAASDIVFQRPLRVGSTVTRRSALVNITEKQARTGPCVFVSITHELREQEEPILTERQTLVFTETAEPLRARPPATAAPTDSSWERRVDPDPVLLFRFSALTFNSHRIHYDREYAMRQEGYPGLVVQGPLLATLLLWELVTRHSDARIHAFNFRAVQPLFDTAPFYVCGSIDTGGARLHARDDAGSLCMSATASLG
jgi:3-methylfumaryl-CoA hydratase